MRRYQSSGDERGGVRGRRDDSSTDNTEKPASRSLKGNPFEKNLEDNK
jgi:hypothetical protein